MRHKKTRLDPRDVDYKNLDLLKKHLTETNKLLSAKLTGLDSRSQRIVAREVKHARLLALLPYVDYKSDV